MENKKIYVDGIDVSACEHYRAEIETKMPYGEYEIQKDKCHYSGIEVIQDCKGNKGCIYKQLQRLQAEYDDLHLTYAGCKTANTGLQELNQKLQAENEKLKTNIGIYKGIIDSDKEENERLKKDLEIALREENRWKSNCNNYREICQKRYQTLQEIRELIKKLDLSLGCAYGDYDCEICSDINEETVCEIKLQNIIITKINEVIGGK